jgi:arsenate reductase
MITIYHNPACGTSRTALGLIRNSGTEPAIIEYLQAPPERSTLIALRAAMGIPVRALLRQKGTPYEDCAAAIRAGATMNSSTSCSAIRS